MPLTLKDLKSNGKFDEFVSIIKEFTEEGTDPADNLSSVLEVAAEDSIIGLTMMSRLGELIISRKLRPGVFKHIVDLDKSVELKKAPKTERTPRQKRESSPPKPKGPELVDEASLEPGPYEGTVIHPKRPSYLKPFGYVFPVPRHIRRKRASDISRFYDVVSQEPRTKDDHKSLVLAEGVSEETFEKLWTNYENRDLNWFGDWLEEIDGKFQLIQLQYNQWVTKVHEWKQRKK